MCVRSNYHRLLLSVQSVGYYSLSLSLFPSQVYFYFIFPYDTYILSFILQVANPQFFQRFLNAWTIFILLRALAQFFVARLVSVSLTLGDGTPLALKNPSGTGTHNIFLAGFGDMYWYCLVVEFSHHLLPPVWPVYQRFPDALAIMVCTRGICNPPQ